jgi:hypothetical protein
MLSKAVIELTRLVGPDQAWAMVSQIPEKIIRGVILGRSRRQ